MVLKMARLVLAIALQLLHTCVPAVGAAPPTPGGPYGLAQTPFMGWRSWNAYHNSVTQDIMEKVMEAMAEKQPDGRSLFDLGFHGVGLDDAWQGFNKGTPGVDACQKGYNGTFHDAEGYPLWAKSTFPDPKGMVAKAHSLGLTAGWYMNNCQCMEKGQTNATWVRAVYESSVKMLVDQEWVSAPQSAPRWASHTFDHPRKHVHPKIGEALAENISRPLPGCCKAGRLLPVP